MAYEIPGQAITLEAGADLSSNQFHFVGVDSNGRAALAITSTGDGDVFGVLQNKPTLGQAASIMLNGVTKIVCAGSTLSAGDLVTNSTAGTAAVHTAGDMIRGRIISGSSGSTGRVLTMALQDIGSTG
jgi:hypothetical protein